MESTGISFGFGLILFFIILVVIIIVVLVKRDIGKQEKTMKQEREYVNMSVVMMAGIRDRIQEASLQKKADQICDILRASPYHSGDESKVLEDEILNKLSFLQLYISEQDCDEVEENLNELQRLIKARNENVKRTVS